MNQHVIDLAKLVSNSWVAPIRQLRHELGLSPIDYNPFIETHIQQVITVRG